MPTEFSGELFFPGGVTASFYCSFRANMAQWANASGALGYVHVSDFVVPFFGCESAFEAHNSVLRIRHCEYNVEDHRRRFAAAEYSNGAPNAQETNMIRTFSEIVTSGELDARWGEIALQTQQVIDACLRSARDDGRLVTL